jgi:hypothetical protein
MSEYNLIPIESLQKMIYTIRGVQVMIDSDLADKGLLQSATG